MPQNGIREGTHGVVQDARLAGDLLEEHQGHADLHRGSPIHRLFHVQVWLMFMPLSPCSILLRGLRVLRP